MKREELKALRKEVKLSAKEAADLVGLKMLTWQRWEGQSSRRTIIPSACLELFLLKINKHPTHVFVECKKIEKPKIYPK